MNFICRCQLALVAIINGFISASRGIVIHEFECAAHSIHVTNRTMLNVDLSPNMHHKLLVYALICAKIILPLQPPLWLRRQNKIFNINDVICFNEYDGNYQYLGFIIVVINIQHWHQ